MLMRPGFDIDIESPSAVQMVLALSTHPETKGRLIGEDFVRVRQCRASSEDFDRFDNRITRIVAPPGPTRLWSDCVIDFDAQPDPIASRAVQHPLPDLPDEVLTFLLPSGCCDSDSDKVADQAWKLFGGPPGVGPRRGDHRLRPSSCHLRLPVPPRGQDGLGRVSRKERPLPGLRAFRDFPLPRAEHSGALRQRLSRRHRCAVLRPGRLLRVVRGRSGRALVHRRKALVHGDRRAVRTQPARHPVPQPGQLGRAKLPSTRWQNGDRRWPYGAPFEDTPTWSPVSRSRKVP